MSKKNLMPLVTQSVKRLTIQDLPTDLFELSDECLSQVQGGGNLYNSELLNFVPYGRECSGNCGYLVS
jgi:hypothetical protein